MFERGVLCCYCVFIVTMAPAGCYKAEEQQQAMRLTGVAQIYEALCRYWERCRPERLSSFSGGTVERCTDFYRCYFSSHPYDSAASFEACVDHISSSRCTEALSSLNPDPRFLYKGISSTLFSTVVSSLGQPKNLSVGMTHLIDIPSCNPANGFGEPPALGSDCFLFPSSCGDDAYCRPVTPTKTVGDFFCGVCDMPEPAGAFCEVGTLCEETASCEDGVCTRLASIGSSCEYNGDCATNVCVQEVCKEVGALGELCDDSWDCESENCGKDGRCGSIPVLSAEESCDNPAVSAIVACNRDEGLTCIAGRCVALSDINGPCDSEEDCRLDLICRDGKCHDALCPNGNGAPCNGGLNGGLIECDPGLYCDASGECRSLLSEGESCNASSECEDELYCGGDIVHGNGVCMPLGGDGEPCVYDYECKSGYCEVDPEACQIVGPEQSYCEEGNCDDCGVCTERPDASACRSSGD